MPSILIFVLFFSVMDDTVGFAVWEFDMAYVLFVDESGHDLRESPYEVIAGVAVEDSRIWNLITALQEVEVSHFGQRITRGDMEIKGKKFLKKKTFRLAEQLPPFSPDERRVLANECLRLGQAAKSEHGAKAPSRRQLTALGQAKIAFVKRTFELCAQHQVRAFASIVDREAPRAERDFLRKDYAYLFERFFNFLEEQPLYQQGLVVFDELERARSHILLAQVAEYFKNTDTGRLRASRIIPEPFFVHSDMTSLIQVADLVAYIINWGVRVGPMTRSRREELATLASMVCGLRHRAVIETPDNPNFVVWSFAVIDDLRPRNEQT